jgi:UDP-2-acetamido-3-amino-2,3-dideoxy-glucuronate N-acetyltransferase
MAVFDDLSSEKLYLYPHTIEWNEGNVPIAHKADFFPVKCERKQPLREELLHFLDCIEFRKDPKTNGKEGLQVLKILEKAEKSLITNLGKSS